MSEVKRFSMRATGSLFMAIETHAGAWVLSSDYDKQAHEIERLRSIISDCAKSCGAAVSVECSLDFMAHLPVEISAVISNLREERDSQQRVCITAMDELSQLKSRQSGLVLPEFMESSRTFVDRLHEAWWRDHADAQHDGVAGLYDELLASLNSSAVRAGDDRGHDTKGSRKAMGAMNAKLRSKVGRLERELAALSAQNPADQLNKVHGEAVAYMAINASGLPEKCLPTDPEGFPVYLAASPSIPETSVVVERELLECVERYFSGFVSDQQPAYALGSKGLSTIRAILSRKVGDQNG